MKLIYVTVKMPFCHGEEFLIEEAKELQRQGVDLLIVPRSPANVVNHADARPLAPVAIAKKCWSPTIIARAAAQILLHPCRFVQLLGVLKQSVPLSNLLKNLYVLPKGLWLSVLAKRWQADHIHAHWSTATSTMAMIASRWSGIPWSFTAHRGGIVEGNLIGPKTASARFVRCISQKSKGMLVEKGGDVEKTWVLHMGVALSEQQSSTGDSEAPLRSPVIILCPASLYPVKGHEHLLRAMALLQHKDIRCTLRMAGNGPLRKDLESQAAELGLESTVVFLGKIPHERILNWYRERLIDMVVLPSVDLGNGLHEGIPVSLMEAMVHGLPVISTTTGGISELLQDGAGILVPPQNPEALAEAMARLAGDKETRVQLGAVGRKRIESEFAIQSVVAKLVEKIASA